MAIEKTVILNVDIENGIQEVNEFDNSIKKLDNSLEKVSGNFGGVEKESKKAADGIEEVTKNGGAIAVLDRLTGGLASQFRDAFEATKLFNFSLKGTRTAILATGIGALVIALGLVVAYWDDIRDAITGANKALEIQNELIDTTISNLDREFKILEEKEKLLKAEGKSTLGVRKEKEKLLKLQLEENNNLLNNLKAQLLKEKSVSEELSLWQKISLEAKRQFIGEEAFANGIATIVANRTKALDEIDKQIDEAEARSLSLQALLVEINKPDTETTTTKPSTTKPSEVREAVVGVQAETVEEQEVNNLDVENDFQVLKDRLIQENIQRFRDEIRKEEADEDRKAKEDAIKREELLQKQKIALAGRGFSELASLLGEQTEAGRAAAIASALINTYQGISNVWSEKAESGLVGAGLAQRLVTTAIVAAQGFKAVQGIVGTQNTLGGSRGGSSASAPSLQQVAPQFNVVGATATNQLAESISQQTNEPVKAFVVAKEVTNQQELDRNIEKTATFG